MKTTLFGVAVTVLYVALVLWIRWSSLSTLQTMPLNEFGDFFAGVFGPLMLFWLILGYVQQQRELRQNTKALEIQAKELQNSVEQYKELVKATKLQAEADFKALEIKQIEKRQESLPSFSIVDAKLVSKAGKKCSYEIKINNLGQPASDVRFSSVPILKQIESKKVSYFQSGGTHMVKWDSENSGEAPMKLKLIINCKDANTRTYTKLFDLVLSDNVYHLVSVADVS